MTDTETVKYIEGSHTWEDPWNDNKEITCAYRFRKPFRSDISRFSKEAVKSPTSAQNNLLIGTVHPEDAGRLKADLEEHPALLVALGAWMLKASGFGDLGN